MSSSTEGQPPETQPAPEAAPQPEQPTQPMAAASQPPVAQPTYPQPGYPQPGYPQPGYPQPGYPQPGYAQWPAGWPAGPSPVPPGSAPARRHSAWIGTMTPLTAGVLALVLVLAGFGLGVLVGWQHDGHGTQRVVFEPGQRRFDQGQRPFAPGPGQGPFFNGPHRQRPNAPTPTPSPSGSS